MTSPPAGVTPVRGFDAHRYVGTWYEIARLDHRFERGLADVTADYVLNDDGTIAVINRGYDTDKGQWVSARGTARFRESPTVGSLKVSFFGPFYGGYHIIELDPAYQYALVAGPSKRYLWILSRAPRMDPAIYERLTETAARLGFPTQQLILVTHDVDR